MSYEVFHVFNRGVEKRDTFIDDTDYSRCILDFLLFNDIEPSLPPNIYLNSRNPSSVDAGHLERLIRCFEVRPQNRRLVEILAFCLMPNHLHLMIRELIKNGLSLFMQKFGGYTMYFNKKYGRVGPLFQGKYKSVLVSKDSQFEYLPYYIHLNCLDLIEPGWREGKIKNMKEAVMFLDNYRWSSHQDFLGKKNFPKVVSQSFIRDYTGSATEYKRDLKEYLRAMNVEKFTF